jgi:type IV pilus assembly protein PilO
MKLSDFRNLDFQNAGGWPQSVKWAFCILLFGLIMVGGWYFLINDQ